MVSKMFCTALASHTQVCHTKVRSDTPSIGIRRLSTVFGAKLCRNKSTYKMQNSFIQNLVQPQYFASPTQIHITYTHTLKCVLRLRDIQCNLFPQTIYKSHVSDRSHLTTIILHNIYIRGVCCVCATIREHILQQVNVQFMFSKKKLVCNMTLMLLTDK